MTARKGDKKSRSKQKQSRVSLPVAGGLMLLVMAAVAGILYAVFSKSPESPNSVADEATNAPAASEAPVEEMDEEYAAALLREANVFLDNNQFSLAISNYNKALLITPDSEDIYYNLGIAHNQAGDKTKARESYEKALEIWEDYPEAHNNLGNLLVAEGQLNEAIKHFREAIEIFPELASSYNNLGKAVGLQGKTGEAILQFSKAVELDPDFLEAQYNLGRAYQVQGRSQEAAQQFAKVLSIDPSFQPAIRELMKLRQQLQNRRR